MAKGETGGRYLSFEQRESLRDALSSHAGLLRREIAHRLRHSDGAEHSLSVLPDAERSALQLAALGRLADEIGDTRVEHEMRKLHRIYEALSRLRSPHYGICLDCTNEISFYRLRSDPFATLCPGCQERRERASRRPVET